MYTFESSHGTIVTYDSGHVANVYADKDSYLHKIKKVNIQAHIERCAAINPNFKLGKELDILEVDLEMKSGEIVPADKDFIETIITPFINHAPKV